MFLIGTFARRLNWVVRTVPRFGRQGSNLQLTWVQSPRFCQLNYARSVHPAGIEPATLRLSGANTGYKPAALPVELGVDGGARWELNPDTLIFSQVSYQLDDGSSSSPCRAA